MSRAIYEKPLADIFNRLEEDQTLEFKETLPARDGNADIWQLGQDKIGSYARDTLAKEVVAFANAYGGVIIIGIAETDEKPPSANDFGDPLVRNCIDCVERLGPSLRSLIDPPIAGFDIRAFPTPGVHFIGSISLQNTNAFVASGAHGCSSRVHASPSVGSRLDDLHLLVCAHIQNGRTFQYRGRGSVLQFVHEILVRHHSMLRARPRIGGHKK